MCRPTRCHAGSGSPRRIVLEQGRFIMRKTILTIFGAALLAASTVQIAAAAEHHKARKADRAPAPVSEPIRNSNAFYGWPVPSVEPGWSLVEKLPLSVLTRPLTPP